MSFFINSECIGCTICAKKCPVFCIDGEVKDLHVIDPGICIDCGVCASYCPVDCIHGVDGDIHRKIDAKKRPIAVVAEENCTGCEWCVDVCPFDCLEMVPIRGAPSEANLLSQMGKIAANVREKDCVGCKLCEEVCVQKEAITVVWPDGSACDTLGVPCTLDEPIRFS